MIAPTVLGRVLERLQQAEWDFAAMFLAHRADPSVDNQTALALARYNLRTALIETRDLLDQSER